MSNAYLAPTGSFCWLELGTTDQNAAKRFYGSLFGWTASDNPIGPNEVYTMFALDGRTAGACYTLRPEMRAHGVPPHWMIYVSVNSADESANQVTRSGGKVEMAPFDVMDVGRMAVIVDPTGAHFCVWQPKKNKGFEVEGHPGAFCWADLMTSDTSKASKFYEAVFGWKFEPGKDNSGYLHIKNGDKYIGGVPPAEQRNPSAPPHWLSYIMVKDCDASTAKAKDGGAKVYAGPMSMEGVGRWSVLADPQGAVFALFQSAH
jgi:predicted enzyme related to lactoylglutathione lyase